MGSQEIDLVIHPQNPLGSSGHGIEAKAARSQKLHA